MSATWWPGGLVLLAGVVAGLFMVWRLRQTGGSYKVPTTTPLGVLRLPRSTSFAWGFASAAVLAFLVFWAIQDGDAVEISPEQVAERVHPTTKEPSHDHAATLPAELEARLAPLRARLAENADDLAARKEIAVLLLRDGKLFQAFEEAEEILRIQPDDIDGLYVHGVVRVAMGQGRRALELLDRVLAERPDHGGALAAREEALLKMAARGPSTVKPVAATPGEFRVRVELAAGTYIPPGSTLFAALRSAPGEPPTAVKRVRSPRFPLELTLGPEDSMMGMPLPTLGTLSVRIDGDGNASTTGADDLVAQAEATSGSSTRLLLEG